MIVLNDNSCTLLQAFEFPITLAEATAKFNDFSPQEIAQAVELFVRLGLLRPDQESACDLRCQTQTLTAWLHVTNNCNLHCDYCYLHKTPVSMNRGIGVQSVEAIFRSASTYNMTHVKLKYAGGEPTLKLTLLLRMHTHARKLADQYGIRLQGVLLSNGVGISSKVIEALQTHRLRLSISLDGVGQAHDTQRTFHNGRGSFNLVEQSLRRLADWGIRPSITVTVTQRNLKALPITVDYLLKHKLPFTINFFRENDRSVSFTDLRFQDEHVIASMKAAYAVIETDLPSYSLLSCLLDRVKLDTPHNLPCGVGHSYVVIDQNGNVAKCHMEIERSITHVTLSDPLGAVCSDQQGLINLPVDEKEGCRGCRWRYQCSGGCPVLTYRLTGRYNLKSPNCHIYQTLIPEVLRLEGLRLIMDHKSKNQQ